MKLSVTVITLNEESGLAKCLKSIIELASEIIVVDSGSTDKTIDIAKGFGAKVYHRKFDNYANQKNYALSLANNEWVLSLDGDEELSPELNQEIINIPKSTHFNGFSIPRKNFILGKFIKYTRWQPELDRHIWLWKKVNGRWVGNVHEEVVVEGKVGRLKNHKIHHQYETVTKFLGMMNRYSEFESGMKINKVGKFSVIKAFTEPLYDFLIRYVYRFGFLDGWRGFVLSYLMAIYRLEVWVKLWSRKL